MAELCICSGDGVETLATYTVTDAAAEITLSENDIVVNGVIVYTYIGDRLFVGFTTSPNSDTILKTYSVADAEEIYIYVVEQDNLPYFIYARELIAIADELRNITKDMAKITPIRMPEVIREIGAMIDAAQEDWAGELTFSGSYATATYFTKADCFLSVDKNNGLAFITMKNGTSTAYENIYFGAGTLPEGVTFLTTQTYGGSTSGSTGRYFTAVFKGIVGPINVSVAMGTINSSYDYVKANITITYV